jgi:large subunit ribosomal protein L21
MADYAIISLGGKQYRVHAGDRLLVDHVATAEGKTFHPAVLLTGGNGKPNLSPRVEVTAKVVGSRLGKKIRIGKYKAKKGYRRHTGFRAKLSEIEIQSIGAGAATRQAAPKNEQRVEAPEKEERVEAPSNLPRGYAEMTIANINEELPRWSAEQVEAALEYERAHAARKGAIAALETNREKES